MRSVIVVTGDCHPRTEEDLRLEMADIAEETGRFREALEWRAVVARWRKDWRQGRRVGPDPKAMVAPMASPEHPLLFHVNGPADASLVCPCGHWSNYLCDEPVGRGKTCDRPMCECCLTRITDDFDHCLFHATTRPRTAVGKVVGS